MISSNMLCLAFHGAFPSGGVRRHQRWLCLFVLALIPVQPCVAEVPRVEKGPGFSFDCDNTQEKPCRRLVPRDNFKPISIEASGVAWSDHYKKAIVVSDNYNELREHDAGHYAIAFFDVDETGPRIVVDPLLIPSQASAFRLFDLEGITLDGRRLYAIGSLALHGKNPARDRWERHQFVRMDFQVLGDGFLFVTNLSHVTRRWPDFRGWLLSKSGYQWTAEQLRGRAEGQGINVEALGATGKGSIIVGFRGPSAVDGGVLALEIKVPASPDEQPVLIKTHILPQPDLPHIPKAAVKTLRGIAKIPGASEQYYVVLGPKGYERENLVLARWNAKSGQLTKATLLPKGFVAEGVSPIPEGKVLVVDDLDGKVLVATERKSDN